MALALLDQMAADWPERATMTLLQVAQRIVEPHLADGYAEVPSDEEWLRSKARTAALCGSTADNFHVSDELWERVGLGPVQACFKCFRVAAWYVGVRPDTNWEVSLG